MYRAHTWICFPRDGGRRIKTRLEQFNVTQPQNKIKRYTLLIKHLLEYTRFWIQSPHLTDMNNQLIFFKEKENQILCTDTPVWQAVNNEHAGRKAGHNTVRAPYTCLCRIKAVETRVDIFLHIF